MHIEHVQVELSSFHDCTSVTTLMYTIKMKTIDNMDVDKLSDHSKHMLEIKDGIL